MTRLCSECGSTLPGSDIRRKTCSAGCRTQRSRRQKTQKAAGGRAHGNTPEQAEITQRVQHEVADVAHKVIEEELRPVVREALTEDTLRAIEAMVGLTPRAVERIGEDLESDDAATRQRAYLLITKYTLGHPAILQPKDTESGRQLNVHFNLPRPGDTVEGESAIPSDADELRLCDQCGADKAITEFIAGSSRCASCYHENQQQAERIIEGTKRT